VTGVADESTVRRWPFLAVLAVGIVLVAILVHVAEPGLAFFPTAGERADIRPRADRPFMGPGFP